MLVIAFQDKQFNSAQQRACHLQEVQLNIDSYYTIEDIVLCLTYTRSSSFATKK